MKILSEIYKHADSTDWALINKNSGLNYEKLIDLSGRLAFYLESELGEDKKPIVVYGHKSVYMLICFLAVVRSGRAYCPVDVSLPTERVKSIIEELGNPLVLAVEDLDLEYPSIFDFNKITSVLENTENHIDPSLAVKDDDIFYIIFTSGSSGKPKGVKISENCLSNFVNWAITLDKSLSSKNLVIINQAPFSFDLSVMDLYISLCLGATLWALEKDIQLDIKKLFISLKKSNANVWVSTPSFVKMCLSDRKFNQDLLPHMSLFLFCGETLPNDTVEKLFDRFPNASVINTYGPTESTVAVTSLKITKEINEKYRPLPLGIAKEGTHIFITDENGNKLEDGKSGEILIAGDTVSLGYFNNEDLSKQKFSTLEHNNKTYRRLVPKLELQGLTTEAVCKYREGEKRGNSGDWNKSRTYKTGDEGYIRDGMLFYKGRLDLQIKLHGYRIEIEDIESNLLKSDKIDQAVVIPIEKNDEIKSLTAFVVPNFEVTDSFKNSQMLKKELSEFFPSYMIPKKFIFLQSIPMTSNGKSDRKILKGMLA
ncbi:MAG: D-alanine--poly(phosphoribitol) ligase subunit DltA [Oscillospiraceae bacterium]|jgi:D-alanine--poly(phosphoribitol) ligase subunit 1|nr:D-alanine--poly(phosphoribitol) ligase subunit DltA [Oscillospiraceae bacterium]